jgi:hypothetical protein
VQTLATHVSPGGHTTLQPLQLFGSLVVSVQPEGQHVSLPEQAPASSQPDGGMHVDDTQPSPSGHAWSQPPQFSGSLVVSLHPEGQHCSFPSQTPASPHTVAGRHIESSHGLPGGHAWLQPPQLSGSLVVSVHPSAQHVCPPVHDAPPLHVWQMAPAHVAPGGQGWSQPPQLFGSVSMSVHPEVQHCSTPVHTGPPLQDAGAWHIAATHVSPAGQAWSQPPQFFGSVLMSAQPDAQHCSTPAHTGPPWQEAGAVQTAATHASPEGQGWSQPPQLFGSVSMSVHPLVQHWSTPVQTGPPLHDAGAWHTAPTQVSPAGHAWLHPPQFLGSVLMSAQPVRQHWSTPVHVGPPWHDRGAVHDPSTHVSPAGQTKPHSLQLLGSVSTLVHPAPQHSSFPVQPGPPLHIVVVTHAPATHASPAAQHCWPSVHAGPPLHAVGAWHAPFAHVSPAGQTFVQLPQWLGSWVVLTHVAPQQRSPTLHPVVVQLPAGWHAPPTQASWFGQTRPQPPQLFGSVPSSMQPEPQQLWPWLHALPPGAVLHEGTHSRSLQMSPAGHWVDCVQPTHCPIATSHTGLVAGHCVLLVQPVTMAWHVWVVALHASPSGQVSGFVRQATHTPWGSSQ